MSSPLRQLLLTALVFGALAAPAAAAKAPATVWLCRPGLAHNPCTPGQKTTRYVAHRRRSGRRGRPSAAAARRSTASTSIRRSATRRRALASLQIDPEERSIALYQAARYSQCAASSRRCTGRSRCTAMISAPPGTRSAAQDAGYADVASAWRDYLRNVQPRPRRGADRPLAGLVRAAPADRQADRQRPGRPPAPGVGGPARRQRPGHARARTSAATSSTFRACRSAHQLGCVIAFSTFDSAAAGRTPFRADHAAGHGGPLHQPGGARRRFGTARPVYPTQPFAPGTTIAAAIAAVGAPAPGLDRVGRGAGVLPGAPARQAPRTCSK